MTKTIEIRSIIGKTNSIYEAVILAAKRARIIHDEMNEELKRQLGEIENEEDLDEELVDREKIVKEFDKREKPTILAINELIEGKLSKVTEDEQE